MNEAIVYVIADYGDLHDLAFAEVIQRLHAELEPARGDINTLPFRPSIRLRQVSFWRRQRSTAAWAPVRNFLLTQRPARMTSQPAATTRVRNLSMQNCITGSKFAR